MNEDISSIIRRLSETHSLSVDDYEQLITGYTEEAAKILRALAVKVRREIYGNTVYVRGLIEISNICRNDCYYCGIRRSNTNCERYRLTHDERLSRVPMRVTGWASGHSCYRAARTHTSAMKYSAE